MFEKRNYYRMIVQAYTGLFAFGVFINVNIFSVMECFTDNIEVTEQNMPFYIKPLKIKLPKHKP